MSSASIPVMIRAVVAALAVIVFAPVALADAGQTGIHQLEVKKTSGCGCCKLWVRHMEKAGFKVKAEDVAAGALARFKQENRVSAELSSCHTAKIGGYVIEGHVPAEDVQRLLREKPDAIGLTVPGMPIGSPGMEVGTERDAYDVLLIKADGTTEIFASYPARP